MSDFYDRMDCSPPGSSVHEILQARIPEWAGIPSSRGSSWLRDQTCISLIGRQILLPLSHLPWVWCLFNLQSRSRLSLASIQLHQSDDDYVVFSSFDIALSKTRIDFGSYSCIYKKVSLGFFCFCFFAIILILNLDLHPVWKLNVTWSKPLYFIDGEMQWRGGVICSRSHS